MQIKEQLDRITAQSPLLGTFPLAPLIRFTGPRGTNGLAVARNADRSVFLVVLAGEPEGAVYADPDGELYGDKAVVRLNGHEEFALFEIPSDIADAIAMGSRIFEKSHITRSLGTEIPSVGGSTSGIGVLALTVKHANAPQNGIRVSIRKDGRIVGSDITTIDGSVSFRLLYGDYDCIIQDRANRIFTSRITFDQSNGTQTLSV